MANAVIATTEEVTPADAALKAAGFTRQSFAKAWGMSYSRTNQIFRGEGVGYNQAEALAAYINQIAGRKVCTLDVFIRRPKYAVDKGRRARRRSLVAAPTATKKTGRSW